MVIILAVATGVKVYFPSEWGTDLEISPHTSPALARNIKHVEEAREAGLKTVVFVVGMFSDLILSPVFGMSCFTFMNDRPPSPLSPPFQKVRTEIIMDLIYLGFWVPPNTLNIPDSGHHRAAFTLKSHIVQYALRAVIVAFEDPANFPNKIRVWDDNG